MMRSKGQPNLWTGSSRCAAGIQKVHQAFHRPSPQRPEASLKGFHEFPSLHQLVEKAHDSGIDDSSSCCFRVRSMRNSKRLPSGPRCGSPAETDRDAPSGYTAIRSVPAAIRRHPSEIFHVTCSCRKMKASTTVNTMLSLSIGATRDTGPA